MKRLALLFIGSILMSVMFIQPVSGANITISGYVYNLYGNPVDNAWVRTYNANTGELIGETYTNSLGYYSLVTSGDRSLFVISKDGYYTYVAYFDLNNYNYTLDVCLLFAIENVENIKNNVDNLRNILDYLYRLIYDNILVDISAIKENMQNINVVVANMDIRLTFLETSVGEIMENIENLKSWAQEVNENLYNIFVEVENCYQAIQSLDNMINDIMLDIVDLQNRMTFIELEVERIKQMITIPSEIPRYNVRVLIDEPSLVWLTSANVVPMVGYGTDILFENVVADEVVVRCGLLRYVFVLDNDTVIRIQDVEGIKEVVSNVTIEVNISNLIRVELYSAKYRFVKEGIGIVKFENIPVGTYTMRIFSDEPPKSSKIMSLLHIENLGRYLLCEGTITIPHEDVYLYIEIPPQEEWYEQVIKRLRESGSLVAICAAVLVFLMVIALVVSRGKRYYAVSR